MIMKGYLPKLKRWNCTCTDELATKPNYDI